jgi:ferric-dicitrate binding protein FerR (iron transport regulator)
VSRDRADLERPQRLMMAALDDEITEEDRRELDRLLEGSAVLRREWTQLARVKEVTSTMTLAEPPEEVWDDYWRAEGYRRVERGAAWILITLAALILVGFGLWHAVGALLRDSAVPGFVKIAVFALLMGGAVMLASVIREKLAVRRRDPYLKVKR